jgi:hypothetical protein
MTDDQIRIAIVVAALPIAYLVIRLLANLLVWIFPSLKLFHDTDDKK